MLAKGVKYVISPVIPEDWEFLKYWKLPIILKKLLQTMRQDLGQGQHMYITFAKFPKMFDKVTVSIIKSSEESGTLDTALEDLKISIRKEIEFNDKIRSALIYPVFILIVFVLV